MLELAVVVAAEAAFLVAIVVLREPKLLIPCVVLGLPVEVFETQALDFLGSSGMAGAVRSLLNPGQAAMVATIAVGVVRLRHEPHRLIPNSSLILPLAALFGIQFLGVGWSDSPTSPPNSVLILPLYAGFVLVAPSLIEDRRDVERVIGAFFVAAIGVALIAITQRALGVFNWREILVQSDAYSYRANATFADPNILARFLAISMALAAGSLLVLGPRRLTVYLAGPMMAVSSLGIIATASRSGWLMLLLCGFLVVAFAPIGRYTKVRITAGAFGTLGALLGFVLAQGGTDAERVKSLTMGVSVIGQREFLIRAGWEMFKDNPLLGVGSGNYQHALIVSYMDLVPEWARTTLSHTSLVSIMAELGLVGVALFGLAGMRVAVTLGVVYYRTTAPFNRMMIGWLAASLTGLVLHSQSEGRLLDEPFLWVLLALFIALETAPGLAGVARKPSPRSSPGSAAALEAAPVAAGVAGPSPVAN